MTAKQSTFKLFYDNFVEQNYPNIEYSNIRFNIDNIKKYTYKSLHISKRNQEFYELKLNRYSNRIKRELEFILDKNNKVFESFQLLYKENISKTTEKNSDLPFIISSSFFTDYRYTNIEEVLEKIHYNTEDKKNIRESAYKVDELDYILKTLIRFGYKRYVKKIHSYINTQPLLSETKNIYLKRMEKNSKSIDILLNNLLNNIKDNKDYNSIIELLKIAFKKDYTSFISVIKELIKEELKLTYQRFRDENAYMSQIMLANDITPQEFINTLNYLEEEKVKYNELYLAGKFKKVKIEDDIYASKFRETLINNYFDTRLLNEIDESKDIEKLSAKAIELYEVSNTLENIVFEKIVYEASHSPKLKRGNDVRSALIKKMYDMYNPEELIDTFEKTRIDFEKIITTLDTDTKKEYDKILLSKKEENGYHGPLPKKKFIEDKIIERCRKFIFENCLTDLCSFDVMGIYDTRNYDLNIMSKNIEIEDMVHLYDEIKYKINSCDYNKMYKDSIYINPAIVKKQNLIIAQEFIAKDILHKKYENYNEFTKEQVKNRLKDICLTYFKEPIMFIQDNNEVAEEAPEDNEGASNKFYELQLKYKSTSKWNSLLEKYRIKRSLT